MSATAYEDGRWLLCADDHDLLLELREMIWTWRSKCGSATDLLAVGAAVHAIDLILDGGQPDAQVQISVSNVTTAMDDPEDVDGLSVDLEVGDEGIVLSETQFVGTGQGRSRDHHSVRHATLTERGGFDVSAAVSWIEQAEEVVREGAELRGDIAALPDF
jgi:hypothetical protein